MNKWSNSLRDYLYSDCIRYVMLTVKAYGTPVPKGSFKAFVRGRFANLVPQNQKGLTKYSKQLREATEIAMKESGWTLDKKGKLVWAIYCQFCFHTNDIKKLNVYYKETSPDLDKLLRAVLDALTYEEKKAKTGVVWINDARVVNIHGIKTYTGEEDHTWMYIVEAKHASALDD
jgi:Holliday junction resolvase RusA-like endonuclease